jgi:murein DD-endopeptidase MepM/ murein hydrolase activator NlpD
MASEEEKVSPGFMMRGSIRLSTILILSMASAFADPVELLLPTPNRALFEGNLSSFYMYVDRYVDGGRTTPWQGGQFGYVRTPSTISGRTFYRKFHEGIDIRPTRRDAAGEPLDVVRAIAAGTVVHTNLMSSQSNYGRYVVIEHLWNGCAYYSLYAHLNSVRVKPGNRVNAGEPLGMLGYTGKGINRERAHLHLEINLMLSLEFEEWHKLAYPNDENYHGLYNGMNLIGIDAAAFFLAHRKDPALTVPGFIRCQEAEFRVIVPASARFTLPERYPWLLRGASSEGAKAWQITFDKGTVPLRVDPIRTPVDRAKLAWVRTSDIPCRYRSRGILSGSGSNPALSRNGETFLRLISPY